MTSSKDTERPFLAVLDMDASREMKTYARMKLEALREQEKIFEVDLRAMLLRIQFMAEQEAGPPIERVLQLQKEISDLEKEEAQRLKKARALYDDANDYYDEKKLGG